MAEIDRLMVKIRGLQTAGLTGVDLITIWVWRRIQPLKARDHPMWEYSGPTDLTRCGEKTLHGEVFTSQMWSMTWERDIVLLGHPVKGFSLRNPLVVSISSSESM